MGEEPLQPDEIAFWAALNMAGAREAIEALVDQRLSERTAKLDEREIRQIARDEARFAIDDVTIPKYPAYFFEGHWLVTYEWMRNHVAPLQNDIAELEREIAAFHRPWWKRWLIR